MTVHCSHGNKMSSSCESRTRSNQRLESRIFHRNSEKLVKDQRHLFSEKWFVDKRGDNLIRETVEYSQVSEDCAALQHTRRCGSSIQS